MGSKSFLTVNRDQCYEAHLSIIKNSDVKWSSSLTAAADGDFGSATSLAIISIEEIIKALVVSLDGRGFSLRQVKGIDTLFRNHSIRYFLAYVMFVVWVFGEDIKLLLSKISNKPEVFIDFSNKVFNNDPQIQQQIEFYASEKLQQMISEYAWFSKLYIFRQDGFYSDYDDYLKSPLQVTAEEYDKLTERMQAVRTVVKELMVSIWSKDDIYRNHIELMKKFMFEKKVYDHIERGLKEIRGTKSKNPFDFVAKKLMAMQ